MWILPNNIGKHFKMSQWSEIFLVMLLEMIPLFERWTEKKIRIYTVNSFP